MNYFLVTIQGLLALACFTIPGVALLAFLSRGLPKWPFAFTMAVSCLLSSLLIACIQFISLSLLSPAHSRLVALVLVVAAFVYLSVRGRDVLWSAFSGTRLWERLSMLFLLSVYLFWLLTMPLSPYPSHLSVGLGDPPAYFRAAANLVAGRGWSPDYFIGDYLGGYLTYIKSQPLLVLITTFFFQLFGVNWFSLYVYDAMTGVILLYLLSSLICVSAVGVLKDRKTVLIVTMLVTLIPAHFLLMGLGAVTIPGSLAFLTLAAVATTSLCPVVAKRIAVGASAFFLLFVRPEAVFLLMVTIGVYFLRGIAKTWHIRRAFRFLSLAGLLLLLVLAWARLPDLVNNLPRTTKGIAVSYLRFDPGTGRFVSLFTPWWRLNQNLSRLNFQDPSMAFNLANSKIGIELRNHPVQFLIYLVEQLPEQIRTFAQTVGLPELSAGVAFVIWGVLLALMLVKPGGRPLAAIVLVFLLVGPTLNPLLTVRHLLIVSPAVIALSLQPILQRWPLFLPRIGFIKKNFGRWLFVGAMTAALVLVFWNASHLVAVRADPANHTYERILEDLERVTSKTDVVASSYPQFITCVTGRPSVGTTWLTENINQIIKACSPDFIVVDNARGDEPNYTVLLHEHGGRIAAYEPLIHNPAGKYIIFRSTKYGRHSSRSFRLRELTHVRF